MSLKSYYHIKLKIFDASLWICIATIFYGWAVLFFFLVLIAILHYGLKDIRNWLIPFLAIFIVTILVFTFYFLNDRIQEFYEVLDFTIELNVEKYADYKYLAPSLFILLVSGLGIFSYFVNIKSKLSEQQSSMLLIIVAFFISLFLELLSSNKNTSEFIFIAFPLAVITTNYIENIEKKWFKELLLWFFVLLPFFILML